MAGTTQHRATTPPNTTGSDNDPANQTPLIFAEIGSTGLRRAAGLVIEDQFLPNLSFLQQCKVYRQMQDDEPSVGASFFAIDCLIRQVEWGTKPFSDAPADREAADFLSSCMEDMSTSWSDFVSEALTFLPFGWAYHEIVYKQRQGIKTDDADISSGQNSKFEDNKIGWRKLPLRAQETLLRWQFDENGGVLGMWQNAPPDYQTVFIPISRALLFRTTVKKNDPQGRSILRSAYRPWYFKKRIEEIEGVGIERDLAGLPVLKVDPEIMSEDATTAQKAMFGELKKLVTNIRRDSVEGIILPAMYDENNNAMYDLSLMASGGSRQLDIQATIQRKTQEITMCMLTDFITLGHEGVGSYALSNDKTTLFGNAIGTFLDQICTVLNQYAVPRLFALNGMPTNKLPKIVHGDVNDIDLAGVAAFLTACAQAGLLVPDAIAQDWVRKVAGMPPPDPASAQPIPTVPPGPGANGAATPPGTPNRGPGQPSPPYKPGGNTGTPPGGMNRTPIVQRTSNANT